MTVYISGPITGIKDGNREAFDAAEKMLISSGHKVINPIKIGVELGTRITNAEWTDYMRADIKALMDADAIYMLEGWQESRGAREEWRIAGVLEIERMYQ